MPMRKPSLTLSKLVCFLPLSSLGCAPQIIYAPASDPVRLAGPVSGVKVWARDANGTWVKGGNTVTLPDGWEVWPPATQPSK